MNRIKLYLRQAWVMIWQDKLYSGIYIAGTGLSVALMMTMSIILFVKFAPIYPEYGRDRMMVVKSVKSEPKDTTQHYMWQNSLSYNLVEQIRELPSAEAVTGIIGTYDYRNADASTGYGAVKVRPLFTDADYWRVYDFKFASGRPYTVADVKSASNVAVISESFVRTLFAGEDAIGKYVSLEDDSYRVIGVVDDVAASVSEFVSGDIWIPFTCSKYNNPLSEGNALMGEFTVAMTAKDAGSTDKLKEEINEIIRQYNVLDKRMNHKLLGPDKHWESVFRGFGGLSIVEGVKRYAIILLALLFIPALNLSGMISSKMDRRLSELGIRKTYGATNVQLFVQILWENLLLTIAGGIVGVLLSYVVVLSTGSWIINMFNMGATATPELLAPNLSPEMLFNRVFFVMALVVCLLLNFISSIIPAIISLRRTIINSLNSK